MQDGVDLGSSVRSFFVWGLKRSGIHLVVDWLYANLGGSAKDPLGGAPIHPQLCDGFMDPIADVVFFNNCGRFASRSFSLGELEPSDFARAAEHRSTIFGIEDCSLRFTSHTTAAEASANVLVLRDPLNNLASRLRAATARPEVFPVDGDYVDLLDSYCAEALDRTTWLSAKVVVIYNRFIQDRSYRDALAAQLGVPNHDVVTEVSHYGGGSSFSGAERSPPSALTTRFRDHPLPRSLVEELRRRPAICEAASVLFGYDLHLESST